MELKSNRPPALNLSGGNMSGAAAKWQSRSNSWEIQVKREEDQQWGYLVDTVQHDSISIEINNFIELSQIPAQNRQSTLNIL